MVKPITNLEKLTHFGRKVHLFIARGPAYHYTYGRWRFKNWLQTVTAHSFYPDNTTLLTEVHLEKPELAEVKAAVVKGNTGSALASLTTYFRTRTIPTFFFDWKDRQKIVSLIQNDQREVTIRAADEIGQNIFRFRRIPPVKFETGMDWTHCPQGNTDWTWDLNRHAYFETLGRAYWYTGNERYAQKFREFLLDWLANNPAHVSQPNWASVFEVAFRINTWLWAFYYFRSATVFDHEACLTFLKGLLAHGRYLETNLELHVQNNHLLLDAKALAMLGILFPEFKDARKWRERGLKILYRQIEAQVCPDGVHGERSSHYHRMISGELLELLVLLENNNISVPPEITKVFSQMIEFEMWITKPNGLIPLLGDSALEDTHLRFSAISGGPVFLGRDDLKSIASPLGEADIWLLGQKRVQQYLDLPTPPFRFNSRAFPEGGYFVMRNGPEAEAPYLTFDCGPFGYKLDPNHGHADALSFELHALGQTMLVDPGVYSTHLGWNWRHFFRGSQAHNTVVVDNQDQSILLDSRRVYRPAQATLHQWISNEHFDFVDGAHNGYERLSKPITHRRQIFFVKPTYWIVIDSLTGQGKHLFDLYFHLMPGIRPQLQPKLGVLYAENGDGPGLAIATPTIDLQPDIITGTTAPIQGWVSFFSGEKLVASTLRYRQEGIAPVQFCTVLYPYPAGKQIQVTVSTLNLEVEGRIPIEPSTLTGLCIQTDTHRDYLIVDREGAGNLKAFGEYETDAQLLYLHHKKEGNKPVKVIMRGGNRLLFQGQSLFKKHSHTENFILDCEI